MKSTSKNSSRSTANSYTKKESMQYSKSIGYLNNSERREIDMMIETSKRVAAEKR